MVIEEAFRQEPIAAAGFLFTWVAWALTRLSAFWRFRQDRELEMVDLLAVTLERLNTIHQDRIESHMEVLAFAAGEGATLGDVAKNPEHRAHLMHVNVIQDENADETAQLEAFDTSDVSFRNYRALRKRAADIRKTAAIATGHINRREQDKQRNGS